MKRNAKRFVRMAAKNEVRPEVPLTAPPNDDNDDADDADARVGDDDVATGLVDFAAAPFSVGGKRRRTACFSASDGCTLSVGSVVIRSPM